jgi:hypothetical protein
MLLCFCSNKRTDNSCNYTARYILGIHQRRENQNTSIYIRIKLEFKLEVRNTGKLNSLLKERATKSQKRRGGKAPRIPNADVDTYETCDSHFDFYNFTEESPAPTRQKVEVKLRVFQT